MKKKKKVLTVLFILTILALIFFSYKFISNIIIFKDHRDYFNQPFNKQQIQSWMSINYIENKYNIDLEGEFWNNIWIWTRNKTLNDYCTKYKVDCNELLITLNNEINGN